MTSSRPYLMRAIYEWLLDNSLTPYVMVDALYPETMVPQQFVQDGKIILNISPSAVTGLALGNSAVEFTARFSGIPHHITVPVMAVQAIYSYENGRGMVFNEDDTGGGDDGDDMPPTGSDDDSPKADRPHLRVVK